MAVPQIPQVVVQTAEGQTQEEDPGGAGLLVLDQVVAASEEGEAPPKQGVAGPPQHRVLVSSV